MALANLNVRVASRAGPIAVAIVVFLVGTAAFVVRAGMQIGLSAVPGPGDEAEYDLLAMQIVGGHGFRFDYDDRDWRRPYEQANHHGEYDLLLSRQGSAPTTYRPPLFPAVMAALYAAFGRSFAVVRVFNCLVMAAAGAVAVGLVARRLGPLPGVLSGLLFAVIEHRARYHAGLVLTESLASLLAILLAAALFAMAKNGRLRAAVVAGLLLGLAVLNRPLVALWVPWIVLLAWWVCPQRRLTAAATLAMVAGAVVAPWGVRNSLLLGQFAPLGTHGQQNLAAAYSDEAVQRRGLWFRLDETGFFPPAIDDSQPGLEREKERAERSQRAALEWIRHQPHRAAVLVAMRIWQLWQPRMHWDALILGLMAFGAVLWPAAAERRIFLMMLIANTIAVAVTWSVGGRFLVPLLPIVHAFAACGLWVALLALTDRRRETRNWFGCDRICKKASE
jgi:4-amino-4-deoxy-L-arabinose transferase-like glycosyltransferase